MQVLITGVGDAFTSRYFGSSAIIRGPDGLVLLDCPDLIHRAIRVATETASWDVDASAIDDIILTHLHGDHCNGLESFGFRRRMERVHDPAAVIPRLHTTAPVAARLWERLAPAMDTAMENRPVSTLADFYDVREIGPEAAAEVCGLTVRCRFTIHPVPTIGLLVSDGRTTLGWSGDTAFEPAHVDWLSEADLIVHETNEGAVHTPIERLNALPDALRARMRLIHATDHFDPACTDIVPLREGEVLDLS
jgi:ribonuclease BN (tRNA processing enzyme)